MVSDPQPIVPEPLGDTDAMAPVTRPRVRPSLALVLLVAAGLALGTGLALRRPASAPTMASPLAQRVLEAVGAVEPEEKLVFALTPTQPAIIPDLLPAGAPVVYAFYELPGVTSATAPTMTLSRDGKSQGPVPASQAVAGSKPGTGTIALRAPSGGFLPGIYELELTFPETKVTGSFVTTLAAEAIASQPAPKDAEVAISNATFAPAVTPDGKVNKPQKSFWGSQRVYLVFYYAQAEPGSTVQIKWYGGQQQIDSATSEVLLPSVSGWANGWLQAPYPGLPPGDYHATVNMSSDPKELGSADFTIVAGAPPTPTVPATP